jgi:AAA+ ATPase superfamily predicted ATPase
VFSAGAMNISPVFQNFQAALDAVLEMAKTERLVFVIDEYPYLASSFRGFSSILQIQIDHKYRESNLMLILCGSSMSFMEHEVLGYKSPLYGRRTAQFKILPFSYFETRTMLKNFSGEDAALAYGITGGVPLYLSMLKDKQTIPENIRENFLRPNAFLFEEPRNLLKQEVREAAQYNGIIRVIADGSSKLSGIASKTGLETGAASLYLKNLIALGIVSKEEPIGGNSTRKTIYRISDSLFRFWYRFIPDNIALIQSNMADAAWERIKPQLSTFMGSVFEDICKQWLWQENAAGRLPFTFTDAGRWWGNDPVHKQEAELDILCTGEKAAIFAECKWSAGLVDTEVLNTLTERSSLFQYAQKFLYVFAKKGFTQGCREEAGKTGARLISFGEMFPCHP